MLADGSAVEQHVHIEVCVQLLRCSQIVDQSKEHHGCLFSRIPPVSAIAIQHQPLRRAFQQRTLRVGVGEEAQGKGGALGAVVVIDVKQRAITRWPGDQRAGALGLRLEHLRDLRRTAIVGTQHNHAGQRQRFRGKIIAPRPEGFKRWRQISCIRQAECIDHVRSQSRDHSWMLGQLLLQIADAAGQVGIGLGVSCGSWPQPDQ